MKHLLLLLRIGNDVQTKGWYASKTVWFNILTLVGVAAAYRGFDLSADDLVALSVACSSVGNIVLRFITDKPVGGKTVPLPVPDTTGATLPGDEKPFGLS